MVNMHIIQRKLTSMKCPTCGQQPKVTVSGESLNISCCCEAFKQRLIKIAKEDTDRQVRQSIESQLSNALKGFR